MSYLSGDELVEEVRGPAFVRTLFNDALSIKTRPYTVLSQVLAFVIYIHVFIVCTILQIGLCMLNDILAPYVPAM
jgi:hypothetical protein